MIYIELTNNLELVREICVNPFIFNRMKEEGMTTNDFVLPVDNSLHWLLIKDGLNIIGIVGLKNHSTVFAEIHFFMKDEYRSLAQESGKALYKFVLLNTQIEKLITFVPTIYQEVIEFGQKMGLESEGLIKSSYMFKNRLVDMYLLSISKNKMKEVIL